MLQITQNIKTGYTSLQQMLIPQIIAGLVIDLPPEEHEMISHNARSFSIRNLQNKQLIDENEIFLFNKNYIIMKD